MYMTAAAGNNRACFSYEWYVYVDVMSQWG